MSLTECVDPLAIEEENPQTSSGIASPAAQSSESIGNGGDPAGGDLGVDSQNSIFDVEGQGVEGLEIADMWRRFFFHLSICTVWPLLLIYYCGTCCCKVSRFRTVKDMAKAIQKKKKYMTFRIIFITLLLSFLNFCMIWMYTRNYGVDITNKVVSPIEFLVGNIWYVTSLSMFVMYYTDTLYEGLIEMRQGEIIGISGSEHMPDDTPSGACSEAKAEADSHLIEIIYRDSRVPVLCAQEGLRRLRTYYGTHFGGETIMSRGEKVWSLAVPIIVMIFSMVLPRIYMNQKWSAPLVPWSFCPSKGIDSGGSDADAARFDITSPFDWILPKSTERCHLWTTTVLACNLVAGVTSGVCFLYMLFVAIADFNRVYEQALILDCVATYGFDRYPLKVQRRISQIAWQNMKLFIADQKPLEEDQYRSQPAPEDDATPLMTATSAYPFSSSYKTLCGLSAEDIHVLVSRPSPEAAPFRKKEFVKQQANLNLMSRRAQGQPDTELIIPLEFDLTTTQGIQCWWRMRQWLCLDARDEKATMEMLLTIAVVLMFVIFSFGIAGYLAMNQEFTLISVWATLAVAVLGMFIASALNVCVEVNEQLKNDSEMLLNVRYFIQTDKDLYLRGPQRKKMQTLTPHQKKLEKEAADKMLEILGHKIDRMDERIEIFGFVVTASMRTQFISTFILTFAGVLLQPAWSAFMEKLGVSQD